jgi:hypothetical protein
VENCGQPEEQDHAAWVWGAVAAGVVLGAVGVLWLTQYRKPDRSMDRLLRRCYDRLEDIEASIAGLLSPQPTES